MTPRRLAAIAAIYLIATVGWFTLGSTVVVRSGEFDDRLAREVALLWGGPHTQAAPGVFVERPKVVTEQVQQTEQGRSVVKTVTKTIQDLSLVAIESSRVQVNLALDHRRKGLIWYDTYAVGLKATYRLRNPGRDVEADRRDAGVSFRRRAVRQLRLSPERDRRAARGGLLQGRHRARGCGRRRRGAAGTRLRLARPRHVGLRLLGPGHRAGQGLRADAHDELRLPSTSRPGRCRRRRGSGRARAGSSGGRSRTSSRASGWAWTCRTNSTRARSRRASPTSRRSRCCSSSA